MRHDHGPARMRNSLRDLTAMAVQLARTPTFGRRVTLLVVAGFVLLLITTLSSLWVSQRADVLMERVQHTFQVRTLIGDVEKAAADTETHQRGFLLTGQSAFERDYLASRQRIFTQLATLRDLTLDNPDQTRRIEALQPVLNQRLAISDASVDAARRGQGGQAIAIVRRGEGISAMADVRRRLAEIDAVESALLDRRQAEMREASQWNMIINGVGTVLILLIAAACLVMMYRYVRDIQAAQAELDRLNRGLEDQVRERTADLTRANEEIQRFAYIVSHDLRAPLVNVMGYTAELEQAGKAIDRQMTVVETAAPEHVEAQALVAVREDLPEAIGFIRASTEKMDRLINAILKLSREGRRALVAEPLDMTAMVEGIGASLNHQLEAGGIAFEVSDLPVVDSDRLSMEQIVGNLIDNAVKYLDPERPGRIEVSGEEHAGGWVVYRIADNGRGVAERDKERIFELFRRAGRQDQPGEGLGLAFVKNSVRRLGGSIDIDSEIGKGSTFILKFPRRLIVMERGEGI